MDSLIFGTYHLTGDMLFPAIQLAKNAGFTRFDTATIYGNEKQLYEIIPHAQITSKIYNAHNKDQINRQLKRLRKRYGGELPSSLLLHRPMPHECWETLCELKEKEGITIGVSNYSIDLLQRLLDYCAEQSLPFPEINQIEVHPFVDCRPLITYCKTMGIQVQGHTVLTQSKYLSHPTITEIAERYGKSAAQILLNWARNFEIDLCVSTQKKEHLDELLELFTMKTQDLKMLDELHRKESHRFYLNYGKLPEYTNCLGLSEREDYIQGVVKRLREYMKSENPSQLCEVLPLAGDGYRTVGREIANRLYSNISEDARLSTYRLLIKNLRTQRRNNSKTEKLRKKGLSCSYPRQKLGTEYTHSITNPKPMPVEVTPPEEFRQIFDWLEQAKVPPQFDAIFLRGALFPDGRMDLCKQVVGPVSIVQLCESVAKSGAVKHFLLGNNLAFEGDDGAAAKAMAKVMASNQPIETWYLAGNCVSGEIITTLAQGLKENTIAKALWLKRNPIGSVGATGLNDMLRVNRNLTILDLHNCALFDEGISSLLAHPEELKTLKHLYLDANGIELEGSRVIAKWCSYGTVVTLSLSINRLKNDGVTNICKELSNSKSLKRLCLASTGFNDEVMEKVVTMALSCSRLISLNLGCYKSTVDMGEKPGNPFTDNSISHLTRLLNESQSLKYLSTSGCQMSHEGLLSLPRKESISMDLGTGPWHHVSKKELRFIKHTKRVAHIDSIYRNKM